MFQGQTGDLEGEKDIVSLWGFETQRMEEDFFFLPALSCKARQEKLLTVNR